MRCLVRVTDTIKCLIVSSYRLWKSCVESHTSLNHRRFILKKICIVDGDEDEVEGDRTSQSVKVIHFGLV